MKVQYTITLFIGFFVLISFIPELWANPRGAAKAGNNQIVVEGKTVVLDGSQSTSDVVEKEPVYFWTQIEGPPIQLQDSSTAKVKFTAPLIGTNDPAILGFDLIVETGKNHSETDTVYILVQNKNQSPTADAGEGQSVKSGFLAFLDGSKSFDPDQDDLFFLWKQTKGTKVYLSDPLSPRPFFVVPFLDNPSFHRTTFQLTVYDNHFEKSEAFVSVQILDSHHRPSLKSNTKEDRAKGREARHRQFLSKVHVSSKVDEEFKKAKTAFKDKKYGEAVVFCRQALILSPDHKKAFDLLLKSKRGMSQPVKEVFQKAAAYFVQKNYFDLIKTTHKVRQLNPNHKESQQLSRLALSALERQASQRHMVQNGVVGSEKEPKLRKINKSRSLYSQGLTLYAQGQIKEAVRIWKKSIEFDNENTLAINALHRARLELETLQ